MKVIDKLQPKQIKQLHKLYQNEWWTDKRTLEEARFEELSELKNLSSQKHIGKNLNPKSLKNFQEEFAQKEIIFLNILSPTDEIAGYLILKITDASVQLKRIVIDEKYLGIGTEVMKELEVYVLEHYEVHKIWLDVYADNRRAIGLYEKLGYVRYNIGVENHREVWFYKKNSKGIVMDTHESINYLEFPAKDLEATKTFFSAVFGWSFVDYGAAYVAFTDKTIEGGFYKSDLVSDSSKGAVLVVFYSDSLEETEHKIVQNHGTISKEIFSFPGGRRFHFLDVNGNEFAVWTKE